MFIFLEIRKVLNGIAKQKDCEIVSDWVQSCINHLHWSATTTEDGDGDVILAKFKVFLSHILDKHTDLNDQLFNKCAHGEIGEKRWLTVGKMVLQTFSADVMTSVHMYSNS